jgi:hypothetical protein
MHDAYNVKYTTIFVLYIMFTSAYFDTSVQFTGSFKTCTSLSYIKLLKFKFYKFIRLKYYLVVAE